MDRIRKNFGFGCMRLPMQGADVDIQETRRMVDVFLDAGFNYFDTAHGYLQGKGETALKECLTSRYPRERYVLTDKLTADFFKTEADKAPPRRGINPIPFMSRKRGRRKSGVLALQFGAPGMGNN